MGERLIVICQRCDTRFQLDDARVPDTGARVRCSRCKHSFLVMPPGATGEKTVHALAADAALHAAPTPVRVTEDLVAPKPAAGASSDEENEWQFAEQHRPAAAPSRAGKADPDVELWRGVFEEEKPPEALELDELGSPESWSFISEEAPPARPPRAAVAPEAPAPPRSEARTAPIARVKPVRPSIAEAVPEPAQPATAPPRTIERAGWALTGLLLLAIVYGIDWDGPASGAVSRSFPLRDGLVVENLSLRRLENLVSGPVLVVAGAVANPGTGPAGGASRLKARLVGGEGAPAEAEAGPPRAPEQLREAPIETPSGAATLLASPLAPGGRVPFEAVIPTPPAGPARLELRLEPAPQPEEEPPEAPPVTDGPSPRTLLPSSG